MIDLRTINQNRFSEAKRLWTISNLLRVILFVAGASVVFMGQPWVYMPQLLLVLAAAAEWLQWRSDVVKGRSEAVLRKLDLSRSFGVDVSAAEQRDIVLQLPKQLREQLRGAAVSDSYFTSSERPGPRKAIENLVESAWYTKHQASTMVTACVVAIAIVVGFAIFGFVIAFNEVDAIATRANITRVLTAWLLLIVSLGLFRFAWSYQRLKERSERAYIAGEDVLRGAMIRETDALKLWYEYQIGRAVSPMLPDWLWKWKQEDLNDAWKRASGR